MEWNLGLVSKIPCKVLEVFSPNLSQGYIMGQDVIALVLGIKTLKFNASVG